MYGHYNNLDVPLNIHFMSLTLGAKIKWPQTAEKACRNQNVLDQAAARGPVYFHISFVVDNSELKS